MASLEKVRPFIFLEMICGSVSYVPFHPVTWSPTMQVKISVSKNAGDLNVETSGTHLKYKPTCLLFFHCLFFSMLFLPVSISIFYYLSLRFYDSYHISTTLFLISNVPHTPMSVSICSIPSETFPRDSKLEIRPLLPTGQTYLLQPHQLNRWGTWG